MSPLCKVKVMRLRGISDMAAGNAYLPEFMADFNRRFAAAPRNPEDAHRAVLHDAAELDLIFCEHHRRSIGRCRWRGVVSQPSRCKRRS